jgi:hypothetical protein
LELADLAFWLLLAALIGLVIFTIAHGSFTRDGGAAPAALTSLHDFSPADKQRAIEIVVEQKSGKKWMEQESGKGKEPGDKDPHTPGPATTPENSAGNGKPFNPPC